jgi:hypothetical protein
MPHRSLRILIILLVVFTLSCSAVTRMFQPNPPSYPGPSNITATRDEGSLATSMPGIQFVPLTPGSEDNSASGAGETPNSPPISEAPPVPDFSQITIPEQYGTLKQVNGVWTLNDQPVSLVYQPGDDGDWDLWLTLADNPGTPLLIQKPDGNWVVGVEAWHANVTFVNTNETGLTVKVYSEGEEAYSLDLTPYEVRNFASLPPGSYEFHFIFTVDKSFDLNCTVTLTNSSKLTFAAVPIGVAVADPSFTPQTSADMSVQTSPLCGN